MKNSNASAGSSTIFLPVLVMAVTLASCGDSLNSLAGPETGQVYGLVCTDVASLSAAVEQPASQAVLVSEGDCTILRTPANVKILKTVMMPGSGKYSQFEYGVQGKTKRLWISTARVRAVG